MKIVGEGFIIKGISFKSTIWFIETSIRGLINQKKWLFFVKNATRNVMVYGKTLYKKRALLIAMCHLEIMPNHILIQKKSKKSVHIILHFKVRQIDGGIPLVWAMEIK